MRIGILHPYLFRMARGIERYVVNLSGTLAKNGLQVDVLTWTWPREVVWAEMSPDVRVFKMPYIRFFAGALAVIFYAVHLTFRRYDLVVVFFAGYGESMAIRLLRLFRAQRYAIIFHYPLDQVPHQYEAFARHAFAQRAELLIGVSEFTAAGVRRAFHRECYVVHNGTDPEVFAASPEKRASGRALWGFPVEVPVLVTLAALEERKGIQWVIRALPFLAGEFPGIRYLVLGEGPFRSRLEFLAAELGVGHMLHLAGSTDRVVVSLAAGDVACLLSRGEASPVAVFEYMSMGLPSITSNHDPFPEIISREWGSMVEETNPREVAETLARLLRDRGLRTRMGKAARDEVLKRRTWPVVAEQYVKIFKKHHQEIQGIHP
jgi:glycosyltransferase involved in cell wall biosynthesis